MTDLAQDALTALRSGSAAWDAWRATNKGADPLLTETDLSEIDLSGCNLAGLDLTECYLYRINLAGSDLKMT